MIPAEEEPAPARAVEIPRSDPDPLPPPRLGECLVEAFQGSRIAWSRRILLPAWAACGLVWTAGGTPAGAAVAIVVLWPLSAIIIAIAGWEFGRAERLELSEGLRIIGDRWRAILWAPLLAPSGAAIFLGVLAAGAALLGAIPSVGGALRMAWLILPGVILALTAAGLLVLGIPALPLVLSAAALEPPFAFDAAARGMSFLRRRPFRYMLTILAGLAGAAAGTMAFAAWVITALGLLLAALRFSPGEPWAGLGALADDLREAWAFADPVWPFLPGPAGHAAGESGLPGAMRWLSILAGRGITGFALAAVLAAFARTYLLLRWTLDGESPAALVKPGEEFRLEVEEESAVRRDS